MVAKLLVVFPKITCYATELKLKFIVLMQLRARPTPTYDLKVRHDNYRLGLATMKSGIHI